MLASWPNSLAREPGFRLNYMPSIARALDIVHPQNEAMILSGDGEAPSEPENLFYNLPGCSGPVHGFSGMACKTLPFEIVEETI